MVIITLILGISIPFINTGYCAGTISETLHVVTVTADFDFTGFQMIGDFPYVNTIDGDTSGLYLDTPADYGLVGGLVMESTSYPVGTLIQCIIVFNARDEDSSGDDFLVARPAFNDKQYMIDEGNYWGAGYENSSFTDYASYITITNYDWFTDGLEVWWSSADIVSSDGRIDYIEVFVEYLAGSDSGAGGIVTGDFLTDWFIYAIFLLAIPLAMTVYMGGQFSFNPVLMLVTFMGAETLMAAISVAINLVSLWFMLVVIITDIMIIIGMLKGKG